MAVCSLDNIVLYLLRMMEDSYLKDKAKLITLPKIWDDSN